MSDQIQFDITAPIHFIGQTQQITEKFRKRDCVLLLDKDSKWPQTVPLTFTGDRCDRLDEFNEGEVVKITFNLRGREHKGKFYGELAAFKIDLVGDKAKRQPTPPSGGGYGPDDDIPFLTASLSADPSPIARCLRGAP